LWGEGEHGTARKLPPQQTEQPQQLKGVFGEGASRLAVPEATRAANTQQARAQELDADEPRSALTSDELQRRAQSRGLWTDGGESPTAPSSQPRAETLPRAVVGTPDPASAANVNYRSPSIGNEDSQPPQEPAATPLAAAAVAAPPEQTAVGKRAAITSDELRDEDLAETMELPRELLLGQMKQQLAQVTEAAKPAAAEAPAAAAPVVKPAVTPARSSQPNTTLWLALILIAAIVAVLFIGAAVGLWGLPWGKSTSTSKSGLNKIIPAKSLPEMHAAAPAVPAAPAPAAPTAPTAPPPAAVTTPVNIATAAAAAPVEEPVAVAPSANGASVMEAEEAAPLRAPMLSTIPLDDLVDPPNAEVAPTLSAARTELKAGRVKEAEALLRPMLDKHPDDPHLSEALAQTLLARGAAVEAVAYAQKSVKKRPKRASYRVLLGDALRRAGDEPSAKLAYREALALDPKAREAQKRLKAKAEAKKVVPPAATATATAPAPAAK
jgi:hypothetical protein